MLLPIFTLQVTTQDLKDTVDRETRQRDNSNMLGATNLMIDPNYSDFIGESYFRRIIINQTPLCDTPKPVTIKLGELGRGVRLYTSPALYCAVTGLSTVLASDWSTLPDGQDIDQ